MSRIMTSVLLGCFAVILLRLFSARNQFVGASVLSLCKTNGLNVFSKSDFILDGPAIALSWAFTRVAGVFEGLEKNFAMIDCDLL